MGYSENPEMVRVDFFRESGKWYTTEAIRWIGYRGDIFEEFRKSLMAADVGFGKRLSGMWAVCLEPYNEHKFPLMIKI